MNPYRRFVVVAASLVALAACSQTAPPAASTAADEAVMHAATATWAESYNKGDVDKIVALYAEDAVVMPPNAPAAKSHAALREYLAADTAAAKAAGVKLVLTEGGQGISGNLGWHSGTHAVVDAAGTTVGTGKWMEIWRKADGKWLMIRDIWNDDAPAAAAPPPAPVAAEPAAAAPAK